jgi:hypothetical protein
MESRPSGSGRISRPQKGSRMSLAATALPPVQNLYEGAQDVISLRLVDSATRLHAWSLPAPRCVHGLLLEQSCSECDDSADEQLVFL